ncbi:hypothetical protein AK830_g2702 [Neonectria ditissima]|uniref:Uncharacterized protein n=1 Tax=Neonectria ditissima TaxID=78410 RepID=A0A0N8H885_9HYPO|nr:hypothetical protein AK830_g2702 [Neonectria ditissima]
MLVCSAGEDLKVPVSEAGAVPVELNWPMQDARTARLLASWPPTRPQRSTTDNCLGTFLNFRKPLASPPVLPPSLLLFFFFLLPSFRLTSLPAPFLAASPLRLLFLGPQAGIIPHLHLPPNQQSLPSVSSKPLSRRFPLGSPDSTFRPLSASTATSTSGLTSLAVFPRPATLNFTPTELRRSTSGPGVVAHFQFPFMISAVARLLDVAMGQGDGEGVTPLSCPGWTRGRRLGRDPAFDTEEGDGIRDRSAEDNFDVNNKSFLETATLNSVSGSLSQHRPLQIRDTDVADHPHAPRELAYAHANTTMRAQPCAYPQSRRPSTAYASSTGRPQDLGDETFLLSRQTSATTMTTSSGGRTAVDATNSAHLPPLSSRQSLWLQEPKVELFLPLETHNDDSHLSHLHHRQDLLDSLDNELLLPDSHLFTSEDRPSSSRSHLRYWRRTRSTDPDASKYLRVSSDGSSPSPSLDSERPSMMITRDEFEALPPTIQRKSIGHLPVTTTPFQPNPTRSRLVCFSRSHANTCTFLALWDELTCIAVHDWVEQGAAQDDDSTSVASILQLPGLVAAWTLTNFLHQGHLHQGHLHQGQLPTLALAAWLVCYFTTIERSQLAHSPEPDELLRLESISHIDTCSPEPVPAKPSKRRRHHKNRATSDSPIPSPRRSRITSTDQRFYASLPEKIKRQHLTEEEQLAAHYRRQTLIFSNASESSLKIATSPSKDQKMQSPLGSPALSDDHSSLSSMQPPHDDHVARGSEVKKADSFYDSFRWLEEDEGLDLRLYLDDYHINLREEVPVPNSKNRRPSFRRHLSINKLPFGRSSLSYTRPAVDMPTSPTLASPSQSPEPGLGVHARRRSRAMSLISPNKQSMPSMAEAIDPEAAHYQDPEARMKLRVFLASPQKFDEAIEFGFPSAEGMQSQGPRLVKGKEGAEVSEKYRSFLEDDRSSAYSDGVSVPDPDSPKTPHLFEKPVFARSVRPSTERSSDRSTCLRGDGSRDPSSTREMTLRMTLTRPDLRANEEQIYGWKQPGSSRATTAREESSSSSLIYARDEKRKESIERQLAAMDQWTDGAAPENGVVKRMWNRVRRS